MTRPTGAPWRPLGPPAPPRLTSKQRLRLTFTALAIFVVGSVVGLVMASLSPTLYDARTEIQYNLHVENATYFMRTDGNLSTQTELLTGPAVLGPVASANSIPIDQLTKFVSASVVDNSEIIRVDVLTPDRDSGVTLANAITKQYLAVTASTSPIVNIQRQLDDTSKQLSSATAAQAPALQARASMLQGQIDLAHIATNNALVMTPAYSVSAPASPNRSLGLRIGAVCGATLAALVALVLYRRWLRRNQRAASSVPPGPALPARPPSAAARR